MDKATSSRWRVSIYETNFYLNRNYFWWRIDNEFLTVPNIAQGPTGGNTYQFQIFLITFEGPVQSLTSGELTYTVESDS